MVQRFSSLARATLMLVLLVLPWIWPFATGPTPSVLPWLASLGCASIWTLLALRGRDAPTHHIALAWTVAALVSSAIGLLQYLGASAGLQPWINLTQVGEAFGNLRQRNQFATLTNMGLAALLWWPPSAADTTIHRPIDDSRHLLWRLAAIAVLAVGNATSNSRTGIFQLLLLVLVAVVWRRGSERSTGLMLGVATVVYIAAALTLPMLLGLDPLDGGVAGRFRSDGLVCGSRMTMWGNVLHLIAERPLAGWGWRELDYAHFMAVYPGLRFCEILDNAHNFPLHLAVELGIPIAAMACTVLIWIVWRARPWRETDAARRMAWAVIAVIALHSLLEYPLWYGPFQLALGLCAWLLWVSRRAPEARRAAPSTNPGVLAGQIVLPNTKLFINGLACFALLLATYTAWDYWRVSQIYLPPERRSAAYMDNTLQKISGSWLFADQVRFARLLTTELRPENAAEIHALAIGLLHFSPEARVVEKVMESAVMLGRDDEAIDYLIRYRLAFPKEHAVWSSANRAIAPLVETGLPASQ